VGLPARDKKALLSLIEQAQIVFLLTRYPKKRVLDDPGDVRRLEDGLEGMRAAAKQLPGPLKARHALIPWDELAQKPDSADLLWRRAKRVAPTVIRELTPLLEGEPEAAFFLRPEAPAKRTVKKVPAPRKTAGPGRSRVARRSSNGAPSR
jgi:hypothetical protein